MAQGGVRFFSQIRAIVYAGEVALAPNVAVAHLE
jgi:hypothetical protein